MSQFKIFQVGFSYALEAQFLLCEIRDCDHVWQNCRKGEKIRGETRAIQDRFAVFFNHCRIDPNKYEEFKNKIFSTFTEF